MRDDGGQNRFLASCNGRDLHVGVVLLQVHVSMRLTKGRFRLKVLGDDVALDHNLGFCGHQEVHRFALDHIDGRACQTPCHVQLVGVFREFLCRGEGHTGWAAQDHGSG